MRPMFRGVAVPLLLAAAVPSLHGQTAKSVMDRMLAEYERRAEGVNDYTIVQETMGTTNVTYMVKEMVNGHPVFHVTSASSMGTTTPPAPGSASQMNSVLSDDFFAMADQLASHADYAGRETIDGNETHVIVLNDLSSLPIAKAQQAGSNAFSMKRGKMWVDGKLWVPRRMEFEGTLKTENGASDITTTVNLSDYRDIHGVLQPFHITTQVSGLVGAMSPEMQKQMADPETQKRLAELKKQLADMPEAQRAMVEKMMKGQIDQLEKMSASGGKAMTFETNVKEVRVNAGPPKGQL
jgi:hypothetical protein